MQLKPPRVAEILAGAFGALLLVSLFLPWYRGGCVQAGGGPCPSESAFEAFAVLDIFLVVVALAGIGLLALELTQRTAALPVAWSALAAPLAMAATVLVLWRTLAPPASAPPDPVFALLGLVACAGVGAAFLLSMRNEGVERRRTGSSAAASGQPEAITVPSSGAGGERR